MITYIKILSKYILCVRSRHLRPYVPQGTKRIKPSSRHLPVAHWCDTLIPRALHVIIFSFSDVDIVSTVFISLHFFCPRILPWNMKQSVVTQHFLLPCGYFSDWIHDSYLGTIFLLRFVVSLPYKSIPWHFKCLYRLCF